MGKKVLLIGRPSSGKTCMAKLMSGEDSPQRYIATVNPTEYDADDGSWFFNMGSTTIVDIGGNDQNVFNWMHYIFDEGDFDFIFYVFDGNELLKELDNHWKGGPIGAEIRNEFKRGIQIKLGIMAKEDGVKPEELKEIREAMDTLLPNGIPPNTYFIATHRDKCYLGNMKNKIIEKMKSIQDEYPGRYLFHKRMLSSLYTINATNAEEVKQMFKSIIG